MPLNPPRANLAAGCQARQDPGNFERAEIFKQHQIELPVLQTCLRRQQEPPSITRRVENSQNKSRSLQGCLFGTFQRNAHIDPSKFSKGANCGKQIPAPSPHLPVNPARKPRRLRVQPDSSSAHVQAFHPIGSAHARRIQRKGFSPR